MDEPDGSGVRVWLGPAPLVVLMLSSVCRRHVISTLPAAYKRDHTP